jgi:hypothetical protein
MKPYFKDYDKAFTPYLQDFVPSSKLARVL